MPTTSPNAFGRISAHGEMRTTCGLQSVLSPLGAGGRDLSRNWHQSTLNCRATVNNLSSHQIWWLTPFCCTTVFLITLISIRFEMFCLYKAGPVSLYKSYYVLPACHNLPGNFLLINKFLSSTDLWPRQPDFFLILERSQYAFPLYEINTNWGTQLTVGKNRL